MAYQRGSLFLLKVGNGAGPEVFTTVGGFRTTQMRLENQALDTSNRATGAWRTLMSGAGRQALSLSGSGLFTDSASEETVRGFAFANLVKNYQLIMGGSDTLTGAFQITEYERSAELDGEELFSITLESAGVLTFVTG